MMIERKEKLIKLKLNVVDGAIDFEVMAMQCLPWMPLNCEGRQFGPLFKCTVREKKHGGGF